MLDAVVFWARIWMRSSPHWICCLESGGNMRSLKELNVWLVVLGLAVSGCSTAKERSGLVLTEAGVQKIRTELGTIPLFDSTLKKVKAEIDAEIETGIETPIPKDYSGGYTHRRHKRNFLVLQQAGLLYQILEDERYALYVRDMLFQYEAMYKDLPLHPKTRSYARGKLFWQCLNDANWLLYVAQAYDSVYDWLSADERKQLEENLFRPFADHISIDSPQFFNRVHNHSTWGNAAVGMIGLAMGDDELVQRALYGIKEDGLGTSAKDNDGGFIKVEGQKVGFLANIDEPFSPDGYYTEGPYYQRYAMYPFLVFAQGLQNVRPDLKVFEYRDGVLLKAVNALLNLADADGEFFPLNDGQKGMSYKARELVTAVDITYHMGSKDPQLVSIAEQQGQVLLDDAGFSIAVASRDGHSEPHKKKSINLVDGPNGGQGGVAVLRYGDEDLAAVFKYSAQGLSHGHYDKLSLSLFERGDDVLQDYGLVRFVNIEQKGGGNYLKENATWAKQTIAHNTVTQDETSHFEGKYEIGSKHHSELKFYSADGSNVQVISALENNAYPGTQMQRTLALIKDDEFEKPFLLDVFRVDSDDEHQYDLPFFYLGQILDANFEYESPASLTPLGKSSGYQHLFVEGKGVASGNNTKFSWMANGRFYTLTSATLQDDELLLVRLGANDPEFNLRRDPALIIRRKGVKGALFANIIEPHGSYSPVSELSSNARSSISELEVLQDDKSYGVFRIETLKGSERYFILSNGDSSADARHKIEVGGKLHRWTGPYYYGAL